MQSRIILKHATKIQNEPRGILKKKLEQIEKFTFEHDFLVATYYSTCIEYGLKVNEEEFALSRLATMAEKEKDYIISSLDLR